MNYLERLKEYSETFEYGLGATEEEIKNAEDKLGLTFPKHYRKFLSECGMCNYGDTRINGIFKTDKETAFPIVDITLMLRELGNLPKCFIVIDFEEQEYLTLYQVSENEELVDGLIFCAEVNYIENENIYIGKLITQSKSFDDLFRDFLELGKE